MNVQHDREDLHLHALLRVPVSLGLRAGPGLPVAVALEVAFEELNRAQLRVHDWPPNCLSNAGSTHSKSSMHRTALPLRIFDGVKQLDLTPSDSAEGSDVMASARSTLPTIRLPSGPRRSP